MANGIGITRGVDVWNFQSSFVEREMDNAAYTAAHPDDSLILAGPARFATFGNALAGDGTRDGNNIASLLAIGGLQAFQVQSSKPTQQQMAIGSGRSFPLTGKSQTQWSMTRLVLNGRNLFRVLYHNAVAGGVDVSKFDDPAAATQHSNVFLNMDSELFAVPVGIAVFIRNKTREHIMSFYLECCMSSSWGLGLQAGGSSLSEPVSGFCDRVVPFDGSALVTGASGRPNVIPRATLDQVLDFISPVTSPETVGDAVTALSNS